MGNICFKFCSAFLILGDDAGYLFQSVDEVHADSMGVGHGNESVIELVLVVAFDHKPIQNNLPTVSQNHFRDHTDGELIDLSDTLILSTSIGIVVYSACYTTFMKLIIYSTI